MIGCPLSAAAVLSCTVQPDRWIAPHPAVRTLFDYRWSCCVTQPVRFSPLWPASWLLPVDKSRGSKSVEGFGKFMMIVCSSCLGRMLFF